jgi:CRISPR-associated protein Csc1
MQIYRGTLELLDYVFYATVERGKVYETGAFIHNYALAYALGLVRGETYTYARLKQEPHYPAELTPLNRQIYLTPATPEHISHRLVQWNTIPEGYAFPGKIPSIGYPDWGFARVLRPGCAFTFYLLINDEFPSLPAPALRDLLVGHTTRVRLGKFNGKARIHLEAASKVTERTGEFRADTLLNWRDLDVDPLVCDVLATSLPTRLIHHAHFRGERFYEVLFGEDVVQLPAAMRFLARAV